MIDVPNYPICDRCKRPAANDATFSHSDICDLLYFIDFEAPSSGLVRLLSTYGESWYIRHTLESLDILHKVFSVSGVGGSFLEIFIPEEVVSLIDMFYTGKENRTSSVGFAGLTLHDFLRLA
jgi:hypothetical protein